MRQRKLIWLSGSLNYSHDESDGDSKNLNLTADMRPASSVHILVVELVATPVDPRPAPSLQLP